MMIANKIIIPIFSDFFAIFFLIIAKKMIIVTIFSVLYLWIFTCQLHSRQEEIARSLCRQSRTSKLSPEIFVRLYIF